METKNIPQLTTAAILTGGKSQRFGEPKMFARFRETSLLEAAAKIAKAVSPTVILVGNEISLAKYDSIPVFRDLIPDVGPLGGIYTALRYAKTDFAAILPCDMPLLNPKLFEKLIESSDPKRPVVARSAAGMEPLVSIWPKNSIEIVRQFVESNRFSIRNCLTELQAIDVDFTQFPDYCREWFFNINSKEDLQEEFL